MEKKKFKLGLVPKLIIAIIIGILFGQFLPTGFCRFVVTLSGFFSTYLKFIIPLMILAYVTMGIADLSQGAGQLLLITVALAYGSTLLAGTTSYLVSSNLFPHFMTSGALDQIATTADASLKPYFSLTITPLFDTLSAVVLAFILGLCLSTMKGKEIGNSLYNGMSDFSTIIDKVLHKTIIPLLPLYICGTFTDMTKSGKTLVLVPNKMKKITIPTSVKTIKAKTFNGSQATSIVIPKSVKKIEAKALSSKKVTKVSLSSKNKTYKMANNCIYRKSDGLLVGVIAKTKKVSIPSKVKVIDDTVSVMGKIGTKNQVHIPKSVKKVVEDWMFFGDSATVYFHGTKPPVIVSKFKGNEFTALPIFNKVYVPKKAKKTYIKWAKDRDGLKWNNLHTF